LKSKDCKEDLINKRTGMKEKAFSYVGYEKLEKGN